MNKKRGNVARELGGIWSNRKVRISVTAVALVPLLYSFMFLWAFWDPYAKMDQLPVAVVNLDQGAGFEGKTLTVGKDFTEKLKESPDFEWHFVSKGEADAGLESHEYYMSIEIPEDFSTRATQVMADDPQPAVFRFIPNESANFLASQIGKTAVDRIKGELSAELTKTYAATIFDNITQLSDGLAQASDGARRLSDGAGQINNGVAALEENLSKLAGSVPALQQGLEQSAAGSVKLSDGLTQLETGAESLNGGLRKLSEAGKKLEQGSLSAQQGTGKVASGLTASAQGLTQLKQGSASVAKGLEQLAAANPALAQNPMFAELLKGSKQVAAGLDTAVSAQSQLAAGAEQVVSGQAVLSSSLSAFNAKLDEAVQGSSKLASGAEKLAPGSVDLMNGLAQLSGGASKLATGTQQLDAGAAKLLDGAKSAANGTTELAGKLQEAADKTAGIQGNDKLYEAISRPVAFEEQKMAAVPNYGTGFAPYFLSLGLFVGALLLTIVFPLKETALAPKSGLGWFSGKASVMLLVGALQAFVMDAVMLWGLGIEPASISLFFLVSLITSWTFMAIIQFLVSAMGDPGRFAAIVLLIFQLTTCAGTFPVELIPEPLQAVNAWLPMTYSVQAFKAAISSGDHSAVWQHSGMMLAFAAAAWLASVVYFTAAFRKNRISISREAVLEA